MADLALSTADRVYAATQPLFQQTAPAAEAIDAGQAIRLDTTTGNFTLSNGSTAGEARFWGVALRSVSAGEPVTAVRGVLLDGYDLDAQSYDDAIFLSDTDGTLADAAGTVSTGVGRVVPAFATTLGTGADKLLWIDP